jgi:hypothetical protein
VLDHEPPRRGKEDPINELLAKALKTLQKGALQLDIEGQPAAKIHIVDSENRILIDLIEPTIFRTNENKIGLFDELKKAKAFAQKLTDNGVTLSFLIRGKKAITLGKYAKPRISRLITRSRDIEIDNMRKAAKLRNKLRSEGSG